MNRIVFVLALFTLVACGKSPKAPAGAPGKVIGGDGPPPIRVRLAAAASLRDLVATHPEWIMQTCSFEASSVLSRQIEGGAAYDVFLSADADSVDRLGELVDKASRRVFLTNRLALILPPGKTEGGLSAIPAGTKIAIAGPEVPAGKAWRKVLAASGHATDLEPRFVIVENVRAALALFDSEAVDAAFVYATDAAAAKRKHDVWIPLDAPVVEYVAVALKKGSADSTAFLDWLASPDFMKRAKDLGFAEPGAK